MTIKRLHFAHFASTLQWLIWIESPDDDKKTALELMNPSQEELDRGDQAVRDFVAHLKRMGAGGTTQTVPDGNGEWVISVEWKPTGKVN